MTQPTRLPSNTPATWETTKWASCWPAGPSAPGPEMCPHHSAGYLLDSQQVRFTLGGEGGVSPPLLREPSMWKQFHLAASQE